MRKIVALLILFRQMVPGLSVINISKRNDVLLSSECSIPLCHRKACITVVFKKKCSRVWLGIVVTRIAFNRTTQLGILYSSDNTVFFFCLHACFCVCWWGGGRISCSSDWSWTSVAKEDLKLLICLPSPPKCWAHRCEPPHSASDDPFTLQQYSSLFSFRFQWPVPALRGWTLVLESVALSRVNAYFQARWMEKAHS